MRMDIIWTGPIVNMLKSFDRYSRIHGVRQIVKDEGTMALFRGLGPNVSRAILMNASQLSS